MKSRICVQFITRCECSRTELMDIDLAHPPAILRRPLLEPDLMFMPGPGTIDATQDIQVRNFYLSAHQDGWLVYREQRDPDRIPPVRYCAIDPAREPAATRAPSKLHPLVQLDEDLQRIGEGG